MVPNTINIKPTQQAFEKTTLWTDQKPRILQDFCKSQPTNTDIDSDIQDTMGSTSMQTSLLLRLLSELLAQVAEDVFLDATVTMTPDGSLIPHSLLQTCGELRDNFSAFFKHKAGHKSESVFALVSHFDFTAIR